MELLSIGYRFLRAGVLRGTSPSLALANTLAQFPFRAQTLASAVRLQASLRPLESAVVDDRGTLTWAGLDNRTRRLAHVLLQHGGSGSRTCFALRNGREAVECAVACARAGTVAVPMNTWSGRAELEHVIETQRPTLLIANEEYEEALRAVAPELPLLVVAGPGSSYERALAAAPMGEPWVRGGGRLVIHTSGTTGKPKGAERDVEGSGLSTLSALLSRVPLRQEDRFYLAPPLFHTLAFGMMSAGLVLGATLVLRSRFDADSTPDFLRAQRVTAMAVVPVMLRRLLDAMPEGMRLPYLRIVLTSGAASPEVLRSRVRQRLGLVHYDLYGATEAGWATIATPHDMVVRPGTQGRPAGEIRIHIVDPEGNAVPTGQVGLVMMETGWAFEGYTGRSAEGVLRQGWVHVGDTGYVDEQGFLYLTGRADDMIITGGENVYPAEVEGALEAHPAVAEAAVVGRPDPEFGQVVVAYVALRPGHEGVAVDTLRRFVGERTARYKAPREIHVVEALPRNVIGKVLRRELRARASA